MPKTTISFPTEIEVLEVPAGQVPVIDTQMPAYKIAAELAGRNAKICDLARVAPTLLERHYADFVHKRKPSIETPTFMWGLILQRGFRDALLKRNPRIYAWEYMEQIILS